MTEHFFTKEDLENLFPKERETQVEIQFKPEKKASPFWKTLLKFGGLFVILFILTYTFINFSAIAKKMAYFYDVQLRGQTYQNIATPQATTKPVIVLNPQVPAKLIVPKIGVEAPITWEVPEDQMQAKLLEGVAHYQDTALPGERGNVFITGHSSYYSWSSSPYKDVFALLEKLAPGDKIYIQSANATFTYEVIDTKVVSPSEMSVREPTNNYNLTLMTCVPIGTNLNRLIITSQQLLSG